ncbi:MAG: hypothetical protein AAFV69_07645 [Pseudomonadota bacterium]
MTLTAPIDLIQGVLDRADPAQVDKIRESLNGVASSRATEKVSEGPKFAEILSDVHTKPNLPVSVASDGPIQQTQIRRAEGEGQLDATGRKLEAFFLKTIVETMLPKGEQSFVGGGVAGGIWRSMLAEQIANEMSGSLNLNLLGEQRDAQVDKNETS